MELKLVYRFLRQVSDWVVDNYYSECVVEGAENVPLHGPIIIASTHHNEMIDIATLAATLPHRRHLAFWAKASMFKNPIGRAIMTSSGAIPVRRNPNAAGSTSSQVLSTEEELAVRASLFRETTAVLKRDGVIGIFPEGTSCTGWRVFQTMPGAAWGAVEYTRATQGSEDAQELHIVPVAITYTDKSKYLSKIHVQYGAPIRMKEVSEELFAQDVDPNVAAKAVVGKLTSEIEARLVQMTVNAADWESICATKTATQILWPKAEMDLRNWVPFHQSFVQSLDDHPTPETSSTKSALCKYNALLHYTGVEHRTLTSLIPSSTDRILLPSTLSLVSRLPVTLIKFALFFPAFVFALPGYITGPLAKRALAKRDEEEGFSQFKAIAGGLGIGANIVGLFKLIWKLQNLERYSGLWVSHNLGRVAQVLGATYLSATLLMGWHNLLVKTNYQELKRIQTWCKILRFSLASRRKRLAPEVLEPYTRPPHPVVNPFIKSKHLVGLPPPPRAPENIPTWKLIPYLLAARREATSALVAHVRDSTVGGISWPELEKMGARVPDLVPQ